MNRRPKTFVETRESRRRRAALPSILALVGAGLAGVARGQVVTEFPIPTADSGPSSIAAGPDGNLWFVEANVNKIGRITPTGVITEFAVPTAGSYPVGIAAGPDGNLWFAETSGNQIGRITPSGVITEFPVETAGSGPRSIAAGSDGNLWFIETSADQIGRITTAGVVTEFPIPTAGSLSWRIAAGADRNLWFTENFVNKIGRINRFGVITDFAVPTTDSGPHGIAAGPDGNLWFTESGGNKIGRITTAGVITEFPVPTAGSAPSDIAAGPDGNLWFTEFGGNKIGRITTPLVAAPQFMDVDAHIVTGSISDANGVLEPGETVQVDPFWKNTLPIPETFTGTASNLGGAAGPTYTINDSAADYSTVNAGVTGDCNGATGDCYLMTVSGTRPSAHWDAAFTEALSFGSNTKAWTLHVGESFPDVPTSNELYGFIENLFHNGVTGGCAGGNYCPDNGVTRAQMAVFLLKGKLGASHVPPPASGTVFNDVHMGDFAADWIEELAGLQITGGCGGANYCPNNPVTRAQMAVFLLKAAHGSAYTPPDCTGVFADVECSPVPAFAVNWIEQLAVEGITGGCGGGNYCPGNPNTRGQMAAFLVRTFGLQLYGP